MSGATTDPISLISGLLTPVCQLHESCQLWREYASSELRRGASAEASDSEEVQHRQDRCCVNCGCPCHSGWGSFEYLSDDLDKDESDDEFETAAAEEKASFEHRRPSRTRDFPPKSNSAAALSKYASGATPEPSRSEDSLRQAALDDWQARKSAEIRLSRQAASQRSKDEKDKRLAAEQTKREEGRSAYESWMKRKRESGWSRKGDGGGSKSEQEARAEQAQKKADAETAIAKWRDRKDAEQLQARRERRQREREAAAAKAAEAEEKKSQTGKATEKWTARKLQTESEKRQMRREAELQAQEDRRQLEAEKLEAAKWAFQEWNRKKEETDEQNSEQQQQQQQQQLRRKPAAWRPNSTARRR